MTSPPAGESIPFYTVALKQEPPYVVKEVKADGTPVFSGFVIDVLDYLSSSLRFNLALHETEDGLYGSRFRNHSWSGMIGEVQRGEADIAAGAITVTSERSRMVDFSRSILTSGIQMLVKKPERQWPGLGILVEPFTTELWFLVLIFFIIVSFLMFIIGRFSPYEWGRVTAEGDKRGARHTLSLRNSFLFAFSTITWQGYREAPRSLSGRVLAAFWWIFSLFGVVAFTANLTAYLMARGDNLPGMPFSGYGDVANTDIKVGVLKGGSTGRYIADSAIEQITHLRAHMSAHGDNVASLEDGVKNVKNGKHKYVMLMESITARYVASNNCDLMLYGESLFPHSLAFACRKNSGICEKLSEGILRMQEDDTLQDLLNKHWNGKCKEIDWEKYAQKVDTPIRAYPVSGYDLSVAIILLVLGIILAIVLLIAEIVIFKVWGTKEKPIPDIPRPIIKAPKMPKHLPHFRKSKAKPGDPATATQVDETAGEGQTAEDATEAAETTPLAAEREPEAGASHGEQAQADEPSPTEDQAAADSNELKSEA